MSFDILKSVVDFLLKVWNFAGFLAFGKSNYYVVIYRGTKAIRSSEGIAMFKWPFIEQYKYLPYGDTMSKVFINRVKYIILTNDKSYVIHYKIVDPVKYCNVLQCVYSLDTIDTVRLDYSKSQLKNIFTSYLFNDNLNEAIKILQKECLDFYGVEVYSVKQNAESNRFSLGV